MSLSLFFGGIEDTTIERWVHYVEDYIYSTGPLLVALRQLSNVPTKTALLEELAGATMLNSRAYHAFEGMFNQFKLQNPHIVAPKLVIIAWDSRHIPIPHTSSFNHQRRLFSTKIHGNALVELVSKSVQNLCCEFCAPSACT